MSFAVSKLKVMYGIIPIYNNFEARWLVLVLSSLASKMLRPLMLNAISSYTILSFPTGGLESSKLGRWIARSVSCAIAKAIVGYVLHSISG